VFARVVTNQIQPGKIDQWLALIRDSVVPALKEQHGFLGFVTLVDRKHDKTIGSACGRARLRWPRASPAATTRRRSPSSARCSHRLRCGTRTS
jgi:hypothetical protein